MKLPDPPREVRFTAGAQAGRIALVAGLLLLPALILWAGERSASVFRLLLEEGEVARAEVTRAARRGGKGNGTHLLEFRFRAGGEERTGSARVSARTAKAHPAGTQVLITYLPRDPSVVRVGRVDEARAEAPRREARLAAAITGGVLAIAAVLVELWLRRQRALARDGTAATATVTGIRPVRGKRPQRFQVSYRFEPPSAAPFEGRAVLAGADAGRLQSGDPLTVLYDPHEPRRNCLQMGLTAVRFASLLALLALLACASDPTSPSAAAPGPLALALEPPALIRAGAEASEPFAVTITNVSDGPVVIARRVRLQVLDERTGSIVFSTAGPPEPQADAPVEPYCPLELAAKQRYATLEPGASWRARIEPCQVTMTARRCWTPAAGTWQVRAVYEYFPEDARLPCTGPGDLRCARDPSLHSNPAAPWNRAPAARLVADRTVVAR
jgi:hypothetical protein